MGWRVANSVNVKKVWSHSFFTKQPLLPPYLLLMF